MKMRNVALATSRNIYIYIFYVQVTKMLFMVLVHLSDLLFY